MKTRSLIIALVGFWLSTGAGWAVSKPVITVKAPSVGAGGTATLVATIESGGLSTTVTFSIWRDLASVRTLTSDVPEDVASQDVSEIFSALIGGQTYSYKVTATNSAGTASSGVVTGLFALPAIPIYGPTVTLSAASKVGRTTGTLNATVTGNGSPGYSLYFLYGKLVATTQVPVVAQVIDKDTISEAVAINLSGLDQDAKYFFRLVVTAPDLVETILPTPPAADSTFTTANIAPVAVADSVSLDSAHPVSIPVLKNDSDADGDTLEVNAITEEPSFGTATINKTNIIYTPAASFAGADTFTYQISDGHEGRATAVVTVKSLRVAAAGENSALIKDADGKVVGLVRIDALPDGSFTGRLEIQGEKYRLSGRFDAEGHFQGIADSGNGAIGVKLDVTEASGIASLAGSFGDGRWTAAAGLNQVSTSRQTELHGRYTVSLPAGTSTATNTTAGVDATGATSTDPVGTGDGWMTIQLGANGEARIKGKTPDGDAFSAKALVGGTSEATTLLVYADSKGGPVVGELALGSAVTGSLHWLKGGDPVAIAAAGAPYVAPGSGQRVFASAQSDGKLGTMTRSGGDIPGLTHALRFSKDQGIEILDPGYYDGFSIKQDVRSGIFRGRFRDPSDPDRRISYSGILLQDQKVGRGVFMGSEISGRIEITITADATTGATAVAKKAP